MEAIATNNNHYRFHNDYVAEDGKPFSSRSTYLRYVTALQEHWNDYETEQSCYSGQFVFPSWSNRPYYLYLFRTEDDYRKTLSYLSLRWHFEESEAVCLNRIGNPPSRFPCIGCFFDEDEKYIRYWNGDDLTQTINIATKKLYDAFESLGIILRDKVSRMEKKENELL